MIGVDAGSNLYSGDYSKRDLRPKTTLLIGAALSPHFNIDLGLGYRGLMVQDVVDDYSFSGDLSLRYVFLPFEKFTPYCSLGGGCDANSREVGLSDSKFLPKINGTFGMEYLLTNQFGLSVSSGVNYYLNDSFDGAKVGNNNDWSWGISLGVKFYLKNKKHK